jgi:hypothetical protein
VLRALVQSVIRRLPNSLCPVGRIHCRMHGCKWSLLKVGEKIKIKIKVGEHGEAHVVARQ